jgi:hypothetical protein
MDPRRYNDVLCEASVLAGAKTSKASMNSLVLTAADSNGDGIMDACVDVDSAEHLDCDFEPTL